VKLQLRLPGQGPSRSSQARFCSSSCCRSDFEVGSKWLVSSTKTRSHLVYLNVAIVEENLNFKGCFCPQSLFSPDYNLRKNINLHTKTNQISKDVGNTTTNSGRSEYPQLTRTIDGTQHLTPLRDCEGSRRTSTIQGCKEVVHDRRGNNGL
jgi:hypothetical protein